MLKLKCKEQFGLKGIGILAHPRSGSTSLFHLLKSYWLVDTSVSEPFHSSFKPFDLFPKRKMVSDHLRKFDVFKHLCDQAFTEVIVDDCQDDFDYVVLYRKNLLKAAVSYDLARRTKSWGLHNSYRDRLSDLNLTLKFHSIETYLSRILKQRDFLKSVSCAKISLTYEDLYEVADDQKVKKINEILQSLNYPLDLSFHHKIDERGKQNSFETYMMVKNIEEIEKEFGKEYGSLFEND